jgi:hypothetical protein
MSQSADEMIWDLLMEDLADYLAEEERSTRSHGWCCDCCTEHREVSPDCWVDGAAGFGWSPLARATRWGIVPRRLTRRFT